VTVTDMMHAAQIDQTMWSGDVMRCDPLDVLREREMPIGPVALTKPTRVVCRHPKMRDSRS
jgi:hypothetical protein